MEIWESSSDGRRQSALSLACLAIGLVLALNLHDFEAAGSSRQAGFLLGVLLALIGTASLAVGGPQSVVVDPHKRTVTVHDRRLAGDRLRSIAFSEIGHVQVAYLQTRSHQVLQYFLQLQLRSGETYALFAPGRMYPGASDPALVAGWKSRLERYLETNGHDPDLR